MTTRPEFLPVRALLANVLAWALLVGGWLVLGAIGRWTTALWLAGLVPVATWLAVAGLAGAASAAIRSRASAPRSAPWLARSTIAGAGLLTMVGLAASARTASGLAAVMAAAGWGVLSFSALRVAGTSSRRGASSRTQAVAAAVGTALGWWVAADVGTAPMSEAVVPVIVALVAACVALMALVPRRVQARTGGAVASTSPPTASCETDPASPVQWPLLGARWVMLPMMAAMAVASDWCAGDGLTARQGVALHLAAMVLPALLLNGAPGRSRAVARRGWVRGLSLRASQPAWIATIMGAGLVALALLPGVRGWMAMSLLHAVGWGLAWSHDLRGVEARRRRTAPRPRARVLVAVMPALAVLALGATLAAFGFEGLVAVHVALGLLALAGGVAWAASGGRSDRARRHLRRPPRDHKEMFS